MSNVDPFNQTDHREPRELDDGFVLEPVPPHREPPGRDPRPMVRDARGRLWRVRAKGALGRLLLLRASIGRTLERLLYRP